MNFNVRDDAGALLLGHFGQFELYVRLDPDNVGTCDIYARRDNEFASVSIFEHHANPPVVTTELAQTYPEAWRPALREAINRLRRYLGWYVIDYAQLGLEVVA